jgi:hypothetical protein
MKFSKEILCVLAATLCIDVKSTFDKLSPTQAPICLQKNIPNNNEIKEAMKTNLGLSPLLPTALTFPSLAIPTTKVVKTSGDIIICTSLMKTVASILFYC